MKMMMTTEAIMLAALLWKRLLIYSGSVMAFRRTDTLRRPCENRISPMGSSTTCATGIIR